MATCVGVWLLLAGLALVLWRGLCISARDYDEHLRR